jgi:hypothetical protein
MSSYDEPPSHSPPGSGAPGARLVKVGFDELEVGRRYGPFPYRITREQSDGLRGPVGEVHRGETVPPGVFPILFLRGFADALGGIPPGGLLAREELEIDALLPAEAEVLVEVWIGEKFVKRGRPRAVFEFSVTPSGGGRRVASGRMVIVWAPVEEQERA